MFYERNLSLMKLGKNSKMIRYIKRINRNYLGIELNKSYIEIAEERIKTINKTIL